MAPPWTRLRSSWRSPGTLVGWRGGQPPFQSPHRCLISVNPLQNFFSCIHNVKSTAINAGTQCKRRPPRWSRVHIGARWEQVHDEVEAHRQTSASTRWKTTCVQPPVNQTSYMWSFQHRPFAAQFTERRLLTRWSHTRSPYCDPKAIIVDVRTQTQYWHAEAWADTKRAEKFGLM